MWVLYIPVVLLIIVVAFDIPGQITPIGDIFRAVVRSYIINEDGENEDE